MSVTLFSFSSSQIHEQGTTTIVETTTTRISFEPSLKPMTFLIPFQAAALATAYFDLKKASWIQLGIITTVILFFIKIHPIKVTSSRQTPPPATPQLSPILLTSPQAIRSPEDPQTSALFKSIEPKALFQEP